MADERTKFDTTALDQIENQIGDALKPFTALPRAIEEVPMPRAVPETGPHSARPRIFPVPDREPEQIEQIRESRNVFQWLAHVELLLMNIDKHIDRRLGDLDREQDKRLSEQSTNLAKIVSALDERMRRIEDAIGAGSAETFK